MEALIGLGVIGGLVAVHMAYASWLTKGIQPRELTTRVPTGELRRLFELKVAGAGWKVVDDGNPMVAQSPLLTGIRQQIAMQVRDNADGTTTVRVGPQRWVTSWGVPAKAHTIRMRLNGFVTAVRSADGARRAADGSAASLTGGADR